jgi:arginine deiminase
MISIFLAFSKVEKLKEELNRSQNTVKDQEKEIVDLKSALARVTRNNSDMMNLLAKNVGLSDMAKKLQDENENLIANLRRERNAVAMMRSGLTVKEKEVRTLRKTIT